MPGAWDQAPRSPSQLASAGSTGCLAANGGRGRLPGRVGLKPTEHPAGVGEYIPADPTVRTDVPWMWVAGNVTDLTAHVGGAGLSLTLGGAVQQIPGAAAYEGVFAPAASPASGYIAYVENLATGGQEISVALIPFILNDWRPIPFTAGTEPDWQPVAPLSG